MKNQEADTICKALTNYWIYRHGKPRIAVSDQAKNIDGTMVHQLCDKLGIEKRRSSPYHPEGNGQAERSVQTVKMRARCVINEGSIPKYDWPSVMQKIVFCINTTINDSTKYSPYQIMYGDVLTRDSSICGPQVSRDTGSIELEEIMEESRAEVVRIWQDVAQNLNRAKETYKSRYNQGRKQEDVRIGDLAYIKVQQRLMLDPAYDGPYEVVRIMHPNIQIRDLKAWSENYTSE